MCEIVSQSDVRSGELPQQTAHAGLMPTHQLAEGMLIVIGKNSRDEIRISKLHSRNITVEVAKEECPFCLLVSI